MKQSSGKQTHMLLLSKGPRREDTDSSCTTHLNRDVNMLILEAPMTVVFSRGLDYVIAVCGKYGIKVTP